MFLLFIQYDISACKPHVYKRRTKIFKKRVLIWPRLEEKRDGREKQENWNDLRNTVKINQLCCGHLVRRIRHVSSTVGGERVWRRQSGGFFIYFIPSFFLPMLRITRISYINRQRSKGTRMCSGMIFEAIICSGLWPGCDGRIKGKT